MGGLIARSYLSGKSTTPGIFAPPEDHRVRKLITIATPHFGSFQAVGLATWFTVQLPQMEPGSDFLWDLATWNQGHDDLRGVDALAVLGNAASGGSHDGTVTLTSGSVGFAIADPQRTRVVHYCHSTPPVAFGMDCEGHAGIAAIKDEFHDTGRIVRSFLNGTTEWQSIGVNAIQDSILRSHGGLYLRVHTERDVPDDINSIRMDDGLGEQYIGTTFHDDFVSSGQHTFKIDGFTYSYSPSTLDISQGTFNVYALKVGPKIIGVSSSLQTGLAERLTVASGSNISVSGYNLSSTTSTQLTADGVPLKISQISDQRLIAYLPPRRFGLVAFKVVTDKGQHTVHILTSPAYVAPTISLSKTRIDFSYIWGEAPPHSQTLAISNIGGGTLSWSVKTNSQWLSLSPSSGIAPASLTASVNVSSLNPGMYAGTITITGAGATNSPTAIPVSLTVSAPPSIVLSKTQFQFTAAQGGAAPPAQTLTLTNAGSGTLSWSASSSKNWLTVSPSYGTAPTSITFTVNPSSLSAGMYSGEVSITASGAANSPLLVPVTLTMTAAAPSIALSQAQCQFSYMLGGVAPAPQTVTVFNAGAGALSWSAASNAQWLIVSPGSGMATATLTVSANPTSLSAGTYNGTVTLTAAGAANSPKTLPVTLVVSTAEPVFFPQVAVGGSDASGGIYSTVFTLLNTGSSPLNGNLILTGHDGTPLLAKLSSGQTSNVSATIPVSLNPGQTVFIAASTPDPSNGDLHRGWGRVVSSGGALNGVATFQLVSHGTLQTVAGILSARAVSQATIPLDDDVASGRLTGYAVANVSDHNIVVSARQISSDGTAAASLSDVSLAPGQQKAAFFFQDPNALQKFAGSAALSSQNGQFAVVALVQNQGLLTAIPVSSGVSASPNTTFGHLAIGGGYSTVLALLNAGTSTLTGRVALSGQDGKPIPAHISDGQTSVVDSNLPVSIQAGGAKFLALNPVNDADPTRVAWANVSSTGGALAGVATFQVTSSTGVLQTIAGVFPSAAATAATMVVDDSEGENRYTGFAIANPGASAVTVKIVEVEADGSSTTLLSPITVGPGQQVARFFFQDPQAKKTFQGSAAFIGQNGATFSLVGLVQNQGLLTAIPVTPAKAPNIN